MRSRRWFTWAVYLVSVVLVLDVLGFVTWHMLRLETADVESGAENDRQERIRLALWRMDSFMAPVIAQESARPYFHYRAYYPAERAYTRMWEELQPGDVLVPSPLLLASKLNSMSGALIRLHFQIEPGGVVTSPQVPTGNLLDLAESKLGLAPQIARSEEALAQLKVLVAESPQLSDRATAVAGRSPAQQVADGQPEDEFDIRQRSFGQTDAPGESVRLEAARDEIASAREAIQQDTTESSILVGSFRPVWASIGEGTTELMFIRSVTLDGQQFRQGIWIDWRMLRQLLLSYVPDLFRTARLEPLLMPNPDSMETTEMLASLPARLDPGDPLPLPPIGFSWTRQVLVVTWVAVLAGVVAIGLVLRASIRLSDRRGRFVSAVTHELRTPLTTFCLYTEMLADGVVKDEPTRASYLETLKGESRRLAGIVENVLAYARLGRPKPAAQPRVEVGTLVESLEPIIRRRAAESGAQVSIESDLAVRNRAVLASTESVERIVMNLIENACKYGHADGEPARVEVRFDGARADLEVRVRDFGPGIAPADASRVFAAFHRGSEHGSHAQPGLGLGLALARGLARELGGDLVLEATEGPGAAFLLRLRWA